MSDIRLAIIGAGHLGRIHARLANNLTGFKLVGVVDPSEASRRTAAEQCDCPTFASVSEIVGSVDAAIVATPTTTHGEISSALLSNGIHCLVEKPLVTTAREARQLRDIAKRKGCVIQVGHVERFNPAWTAARDAICQPKYIEAARNGVYTGRSTDIGIVFDLMIHDIDLVLQIAKGPVTQITASSHRILGQHEDIAKATLRFASGCVANLSASRIEPETTRTMKIVTERTVSDIDFGAATVNVATIADDVLAGDRSADQLNPEERLTVKDDLFHSWMPREQRPTGAVNAIECELLDFQNSIRTGTMPTVTAEHAIKSVAIAERILESARQNSLQHELFYNSGSDVIPAADRFRKAG